MKKNLLAIVLALVMSMTAFTGCSFGDDGNVKIDPNKTQLYVNLYNGGLGKTWLEKVARSFEAEPGNEKIQVVIDAKRDEYNTIRSELLAGSTDYDIYFSDGVKLEELVYLNLIEDLTATMNDPIDGETESILDKMSADQKRDWNKGSAASAQYYAVPYQITPSGIVYDHELFENRGILKYGNGPDGIAGTYDDGLPATYDDFKAMLTLMSQSGVTPFIFTTQYEFYVGFTLRAIWAQVEGIDDFRLNYTFEGEDNDNGTGDDAIGAVTPETGYKLFKQKGLKQSLQFAYDCLRGPYTHDSTFKQESHVQAQDKFILSGLSGTQPVGMIFTGSWWENESRGTFMSAFNEYGTHDYRLLPLPRFDGQKGFKPDGGGSMLFNWNDDTAIFINKNARQKDLAKRFLKYVCSDASMETFTLETGCIRALDYDISDEAYNKLTKFGQNVWTVCRDTENIMIVGKQSSSPLINFTSPALDNYRFDATVGGIPYSWPATAMHNNTAITAQAYFEGMQAKYSATNWATIYKQVEDYFV